jgi:hemerythrin-like domain-containing protein
MPEVLDELRQEHAGINGVLRVLERQAQAIETAGHPDLPLLDAVVDYFSGFPDRCHHPKEDMVYARLRERDPAAALSVGDLGAEHRRLAAQLHDFALGLAAMEGDAELSRTALARLARDFIALQRQHIAAEEKHFFPAAERALRLPDWRALETAMHRAPDPLFADTYDRRFEALRRKIAAWDATERAPTG